MMIKKPILVGIILSALYSDSSIAELSSGILNIEIAMKNYGL